MPNVIPSRGPVKKRAATKNFHLRARKKWVAPRRMTPGDITFSKQKITM
jgi:hypothetical protein